MTERGLILDHRQVGAVQAGIMTQTRRVVKGENHCEYHDSRNGVWDLRDDGLWWYTAVHGWADNGLKCPYGKPGDELWVRETFAFEGGGDPGVLVFRAGYDVDAWKGKGYENVPEVSEIHWKPSIHMPRQASRIQLRIKDIRVERVQDISEGDAENEGIMNASGLHLADCRNQIYHPDQECGCGDKTIEEEFAELWNSINAKRGYGWDVNPWCWIIKFERINA